MKKETGSDDVYFFDVDVVQFKTVYDLFLDDFFKTFIHEKFYDFIMDKPENKENGSTIFSIVLIDANNKFEIDDEPELRYIFNYKHHELVALVEHTFKYYLGKEEFEKCAKLKEKYKDIWNW